MATAIISFVFVFVYLTVSGNTKWSGRSMTLLDPTYAKKYIPIVASVSEHQPTSWSNYFFDLGYILFFIPAGYWFCLKEEVTYGKIFLAMWGVLATYFSCVMIRLMLTLAPIACILAGIALGEIFEMVGASCRQTMKDFVEESDEQMAIAKEEEEYEAAIAGGDKEEKEEAVSKKLKQVAKRNAPKKKTEADAFEVRKEDKRKARLIPFDIGTALSCFVLLLMTQ